MTMEYMGLVWYVSEMGMMVDQFTGTIRESEKEALADAEALKSSLLAEWSRCGVTDGLSVNSISVESVKREKPIGEDNETD